MIAGTTPQAPAAERYACPREERLRTLPPVMQDGVVSEIDRLRSQAAHARRLAGYTTDAHAKEALEAFAGEFERKALDLERQQSIDENKSASQSDTP